MCRHLRPDLIRLICAELPQDDASVVRELPADDFATYLRTYLIVRREGLTLPDDLRSTFVRSMIDCIDAGHTLGRDAAA